MSLFEFSWQQAIEYLHVYDNVILPAVYIDKTPQRIHGTIQFTSFIWDLIARNGLTRSRDIIITAIYIDVDIDLEMHAGDLEYGNSSECTGDYLTHGGKKYRRQILPMIALTVFCPESLGTLMRINRNNFIHKCDMIIEYRCIDNLSTFINQQFNHQLSKWCHKIAMRKDVASYDLQILENNLLPESSEELTPVDLSRDSVYDANKLPKDRLFDAPNVSRNQSSLNVIINNVYHRINA